MLHILNVEPDDYSPEARDILTSFAKLDERVLSREELIASIHHYDGLIVRLGHRIDRSVLEHAEKLQFIATATTGLNHIDLKEAQRRNIEVICLKGEREFLDTIHATAEHTWGLVLALLRHIPVAVQHVHDFGWNRDRFKGRELFDRTIGIIGYGRLGSRVAQYALAFGMHVLAYDPAVNTGAPGVTFVAFEEVLKNADIVSLHVPYEEATLKLIGDRELAFMKQDAYLVNTSRGEILDETALLVALTDHRLAGAALDVLCGENSDRPDWSVHAPLIRYARDHENLIITPHIGGATYDSMRKTEIFIAENIKKRFQRS